MARRPRPWYRSNRGWYVTMDGIQRPLGVTNPADEQAAVAAFKLLLEAIKARPKSGTVADAADRFLARTIARGAADSTVYSYRWYLARVADRFGPVPVADLDPAEVQADCDRRAADGWGPDHRRNYLIAAGALLKFCGRPVKFDKPPRSSAGAKMIIPEAAYKAAVGRASGDLRPLLTVLWNTGARPGEIRLLTAEQVDWAAGTATLLKHKTAKKTNKPRLLVFPPPAMAALEGQRAKYGGAGLLFRTRPGKRPFDQRGLTIRVWRLGLRIGHRLTAYGCRHTFCTRALEAGFPDAQVAALLGHTNTDMIHHHYSHLSQNTRLLKDLSTRLAAG